MKRMTVVMLLLLPLLALAGAGGGPLTPQQRKGLEDNQEDVQDNLDHFRKQCGHPLTLTVDWASFLGHYAGNTPEGSEIAWCAGSANDLGSICSDDAAAQQAIQKIQTLRCRFDDGLGEKSAFAFKDGTLSVSFDWETVNLDDRLRAFVENLPAGSTAAATAQGASTGAPAPPARGPLSVKQMRGRTESQPEVDEAATKMNAACGSTIATSIDWASFDPNYKGGYGEGSAAGWCSGLLRRIGEFCKEDPEAKRTIVRTLKTATCHWDPAGSHKFHFELKGGALSLGYDWDSANDDTVITYLWNTLD